VTATTQAALHMLMPLVLSLRKRERKDMDQKTYLNYNEAVVIGWEDNIRMGLREIG
jgi:hypothetical protein